MAGFSASYSLPHPGKKDIHKEKVNFLPQAEVFSHLYMVNEDLVNLNQIDIYLLLQIQFKSCTKLFSKASIAGLNDELVDFQKNLAD